MSDPELVRAFRAAKQYLSTGYGDVEDRHLHICSAIRTAWRAGDISNEVHLRAKDLIMERIGGHRTVFGWIETQGFPGAMTAPVEDRLAYRQRWLDSLIEEFS